MSPAELHALKAAIDGELEKAIHPIGPKDVALEYCVRLRTADGVVSENVGMTRMANMLNFRLLSDAPSRFEQEFSRQVYAPVFADAMDLFEGANPTGNLLPSPMLEEGVYEDLS